MNAMSKSAEGRGGSGGELIASLSTASAAPTHYASPAHSTTQVNCDMCATQVLKARNLPAKKRFKAFMCLSSL